MFSHSATIGKRHKGARKRMHTRKYMRIRTAHHSLTGYRTGDVTAQQITDDEQHPREPHRSEACNTESRLISEAPNRGKAREPRGSSRRDYPPKGRAFFPPRLFFFLFYVDIRGLEAALEHGNRRRGRQALPPAVFCPTCTHGHQRDQQSTFSPHARQGPTASGQSSLRQPRQVYRVSLSNGSTSGVCARRDRLASRAASSSLLLPSSAPAASDTTRTLARSKSTEET